MSVRREAPSPLRSSTGRQGRRAAPGDNERTRDQAGFHLSAYVLAMLPLAARGVAPSGSSAPSPALRTLPGVSSFGFQECRIR